MIVAVSNIGVHLCGPLVWPIFSVIQKEHNIYWIGFIFGFTEESTNDFLN